MLGKPKHHGIPLPKGWPLNVRSAVGHAVSMANVAFAVTRGQTENQFNARVRLQAENDRLREGIPLLHEELRIKDARMEHILAHQRPHYPAATTSASRLVSSITTTTLRQIARCFSAYSRWRASVEARFASILSFLWRITCTSSP